MYVRNCLTNKSKWLVLGKKNKTEEEEGKEENV
jgi:hypothetical protein